MAKIKCVIYFEETEDKDGKKYLSQEGYDVNLDHVVRTSPGKTWVFDDGESEPLEIYEVNLHMVDGSIVRVDGEDWIDTVHYTSSLVARRGYIEAFRNKLRALKRLLSHGLLPQCSQSESV